MEEATEDTLPELPEDLEIILPPEILDKLEEDSFNPDSFTAPPFVPKGKRIFNRPQSSYSEGKSVARTAARTSLTIELNRSDSRLPD